MSSDRNDVADTPGSLEVRYCRLYEWYDHYNRPVKYVLFRLCLVSFGISFELCYLSNTPSQNPLLQKAMKAEIHNPL